MAFSIRFATQEDISLILQFIKELAEYHKLLKEVVTTEEILRESLFGKKRFAEVLIGEEDKNPIGFAIFFYNFPTFLGRPGIYIEDIYVRPEARGKGYGKQFIYYIAKLAKERNCSRLEWCCIDWNEKAVSFYKLLGAEAMKDWTVYRINEKAFHRLAEEKDGH